MDTRPAFVLIFANNREEALRLVEGIKDKRLLFAIFIGSTRTSLIPGITAAGPNPEATLYTPTLDVEYLVLGRPVTINAIPVTPSGIPTPAIITRACITRLGIPRLIVDCGAYARPKVPHVLLPHASTGGRIDVEDALPEEATRGLIEDARALAECLVNAFDVFVLAESIPAGTTTALAIMTGLGYDAWGKVSSSMTDNPLRLKEEVVRKALTRVKSRDPIHVVSKVGDPVHISIAAFAIEALRQDKAVILAGGTQMCAVLALIKGLLGYEPRNITIVTTRWLLEDRQSDIRGLIKMIGPNTPLIAVPLDFSDAPYPGLRAYEDGYVKEGVGAGGAVFLAHIIHGLSLDAIKRLVYDEYERLLGLMKNVRSH